MEKLRNELEEYYSLNTVKMHRATGKLQPLFDKLDACKSAHPELSALRLKVAQYEIIAEEFQPVIFRNSPFYSEMGVKASEYDGVPGLAVGGWLFQRNSELFRKHSPEDFEQFYAAGRHVLHLCYGPYVDYDHHCFPFSNVIENGLGFYYRQAEAVSDGNKFIDAVKRALLAVKKISEKFAEAARHALNNASDEQEYRFTKMIAETAGRVPWKKSETFYEGLQTLWFLHEACASIDGIGMSVLGRPDYLLGKLYEQDLAAGRITKKEAADLLARYLLATDCKVNNRNPVNESFNTQEQGDTLILGGCDRDGKEVCNDVTFMILELHSKLRLIYPKIHCRISQNCSREYLAAANCALLSGRNVVSFLNDDAVIPALISVGKSPEDARNYVAGGCWEIITESCEHSAGANCYFNLPRVMDLSVHDSANVESETGNIFRKIDSAESFEDVYRTVMDNAVNAIRRMCMLIGKNGRIYPEINPAPFFSACLNDCIANKRDYTEGGGRYNPHAMPLAGFAVFIDSLLAIRHLCFDEKICTLEELLKAIRNNWQDNEPLRMRIIRNAPHWGNNDGAVNALANRIINEFHDALQGLENERGGDFQLGIYNYRDIIDWAVFTRATPDGRRQSDFLTQGLNPSRSHSGEITDLINSCSALDLSLCPANSVLTLSVNRNSMDENYLDVLERVFVESGCGMLQLNCVTKEELEDACVNPQNHQDLIVRLYGYSARFVCLSPEMQKEFISRTIYGNHF